MFKIDVSYLNAAQISSLDTVMSVVVVLAAALVLLVQAASIYHTIAARSYDELISVCDDYSPYWSNFAMLCAVICAVSVAAFFSVSLPCPTAATLALYGGAVVVVVSKLCGMIYRANAGRYGIA